jgi:hypothetical protein
LKLLLTILLFLLSVQAQAQVYYLSPKIGTGTDADPYRAHQAGAWMDCTDLKTHMLCAGPSVPVQAGVLPLSILASDRLTALQKTALQVVTGKTVSADTFEALMTDIIDTKAITLLPHSDNRQHLKVHGVELWSRPAPLKAFIPGVLHALDAAFHLPILAVDYAVSATVAWAASISDTFTATNGNFEGCEARGCSLTWTEYSGSGWTIVSNQASGTVTNGSSEARAESALTTGNHEATVTVVSFSLDTSTDSHCGPIVRKDNTTTRTYYIHYASLLSAGELSSHKLGKRVAAAHTTLATDTTDVSAGETITTVISSDQLSGKRNGSVLLGPTTDGDISDANTYTGIRIGTTSGASTCVLDGFSAQDTASFFGPLRRRGV